ncbi:hypothetical protein GCM10022270_19580 [Terriglobus aquaticus]|nr:POTRA domain-containing protein [Terriglobus aquaticus]
MRFPVLLSVAALAACLPVSAQQHFTLKRIVFQGKTPYTNEQLQAASGLKPGQTITTADLTAAAQRLMDTGAMRDVEPSLDGAVTGITAILKVTPVDAKELLPTAVDNLIWLDPKQLSSELHRRVPLYSPQLPQAGTLGTQVRDALQAMLAEKGVTYKVELVDTPSTDTAPETLHFRINNPTLVLNSVHLEGLITETAPALRQSLRGVVGKPYDEGSGESLDDRLLTPFRDTGYLDATISGLSRSAEAEKAGVVGVVISGTVTALTMLALSPTRAHRCTHPSSSRRLRSCMPVTSLRKRRCRLPFSPSSTRTTTRVTSTFAWTPLRNSIARATPSITPSP